MAEFKNARGGHPDTRGGSFGGSFGLQCGKSSMNNPAAEFRYPPCLCVPFSPQRLIGFAFVGHTCIVLKARLDFLRNTGEYQTYQKMIMQNGTHQKSNNSKLSILSYDISGARV